MPATLTGKVPGTFARKVPGTFRWPQTSSSTRACSSPASSTSARRAGRRNRSCTPHLVQEEIFGRMTVHDLPAGECLTFLRTAGQDGTSGGRIYDAHIAEVARAAGAKVVITDNRRHFLAALRYGIRVETPTEFLAALKVRAAVPSTTRASVHAPRSESSPSGGLRRLPRCETRPQQRRTRECSAKRFVSAWWHAALPRAASADTAGRQSAAPAPRPARARSGSSGRSSASAPVSAPGCSSGSTRSTMRSTATGRCGRARSSAQRPAGSPAGCSAGTSAALRR